jgi:hypothetical protein
MAGRGVAADTPAAPKASLRGPLVHPAPAGRAPGSGSSSSSSTANGSLPPRTDGPLPIPTLVAVPQAPPHVVAQAQPPRQPVGGQPVRHRVDDGPRRTAPTNATPRRARSSRGRPAPRRLSIHAGPGSATRNPSALTARSSPNPTRRPPKSADRSALHKGQANDLPLRVSWRGGQDCWVTLTIQGTPNLSVHMPNSSPHICFSRGMVTVPPSESFSQ